MTDEERISDAREKVARAANAYAEARTEELAAEKLTHDAWQRWRWAIGELNELEGSMLP